MINVIEITINEFEKNFYDKYEKTVKKVLYFSQSV